MTSASLALHGLLFVALSQPLSASTAAPCEVTGEGASVTEIARASHACEVARERFRMLFGEPVPSVEVSFWNEAGYRTGLQGRTAVIYWPTTEARARSGAAAASTSKVSYEADPWTEVLPHEISHVLLAARFFGVGSWQEEQDGYGTPFPDWMDEGVAIWAEPAFARAGRLQEARALPSVRRELGTILSGRHPALYDPRVMAMRDGGAPPTDDDNLVAFYPQSIALVGFIYDAGGADAMVELAKRLQTKKAEPAAARGPSLANGTARDVAAALVGLPGMPSDLATTVDAWNRWLAIQSAKSAAAISR
jgi:hypothetical protein